MNSDPYQILGVDKSASADDIRRAYRKLAKELHPDLNPGNKDAETRFKDVSAAYHLLSDPEQRARYDRGEIDASGAERPPQGFYRQHAENDPRGRYTSSAGYQDFDDLSDIFDIFGGGERRGGGRTVRMKGPDIHYRLEVAFLEAVKGGRQRITMPDGKALDLTIPAGTSDGAILRLKGRGAPGFGDGPPGDALVEIGIRPHPHFTREGDDIVLELPISIDEAVLGGKVEVPTVTGRVSMTLPKGSTTGDVLRLKGKGVKPARGTTGDQRVVLKVVTPKEVDAELSDFMKRWREQHGYDPRADLRKGA